MAPSRRRRGRGAKTEKKEQNFEDSAPIAPQPEDVSAPYAYDEQGGNDYYGSGDYHGSSNHDRANNHYEPSNHHGKDTRQDRLNWSGADSAHWRAANDLPPPPAFGPVESSLAEYLGSVEGLLDAPTFETPEDRAIFLNNVFTELSGHELVLMTDQVGSRLLQKLLLISRESQIRVFMQRLDARFVELMVHRFASHVCQTLLAVAADFVDRDLRGQGEPALGPDDLLRRDDDDNNDYVRPPADLPPVQTLFLSLCREAQPFWTSLMLNSFASHVVRALLLTLAGRSTQATGPDRRRGAALQSKKSAKYGARFNLDKPVAPSSATRTLQVPPEFTAMLHTALAEIAAGLDAETCHHYALDRVASPVLQLALSLQAGTDELEVPGALLDKLLGGLVSIDEGKDLPDMAKRTLNTVLEDTSGSHLFEKILQVISAPLYRQLYQALFRNRLYELGQHPTANFVVQHLLAEAKNSMQLDLMLDELVPHFGALLTQRRSGIVRSAAQACARLNSGHKRLVHGLEKAVGAVGPPERRQFVNLLGRLVTFANFDGKPEHVLPPFNLQGLILLQTLVDFADEQGKVVIDSFLAQPEAEQLLWATDRQCSRLVECILASPQVRLKAKRKLLGNFKTHYSSLACDPNGSHVVDACWKVADLQFKEVIAAELLAAESTLRFNHFGKILLLRCQVGQFKAKRTDWAANQKGLETRRELFRDILGDAVLPSKPTEDDDEDDSTVVGKDDASPVNNAMDPAEPESKRKRSKKHKIEENDEIDELFSRADNKRKSSKAKRR
ncbi:Nucleolar protein 9 [Tieghemiomyces parasiticus]|uniref:Nucleolar protein 9 n=1 Tax=Tieghemiomyces parasiticus TaxID=78921 RepID=A0A9W8AG00_9FUNG|nr:Nucleolar protein 9 [Tieghemiomyces parasiticus]